MRSCAGPDMRWTVTFKDSAQRLEQGPFTGNWKKLEGYQDLYRIRSGDYRIVYQIERPERLIRILAICDRKNLHRRLVL